MHDRQDPPRRWKLPNELDEAERGAARRFGGSSRVERPEYVAWRKQALDEEYDDLALRSRLLQEEAESLRRRAGALRIGALESMSPEAHAEHLEEIRAARDLKHAPLRDGDWPELADAGASDLEAHADRLDEERAHIDTYGPHLTEEVA